MSLTSSIYSILSHNLGRSSGHHKMVVNIDKLNIYNHFIIWPASLTLTSNLPTNFFHNESKSKKKIFFFFFFFFWGGGGGGGGGVDGLYLTVWGITKNPNLKKKKKNFVMVGGGGGGVGRLRGEEVDGWRDEQAKTNLPLQLLWSWAHNNALMYMSLTSWIYDHFIIWPSSVIDLNLHKQMFWRELLLLEDNKSAKLFWNPCINVPVMAQTSSIYDHFDLYLTPMTMTFNLHEKMF